MLPKVIEDRLYQPTPVETAQIRNGGQNIPDVGGRLDPENPILVMPQWDFFDQGPIAVTQSNRFSYIPAHYHSFIELNYVYAGKSRQYLDDQRQLLHPGQLLMMDRGVQQRIDYAERGDILLNLLIKDDQTIRELIDGLNGSQNLLTRFLFNAGRQGFNHDNYLVMDLNRDPVAKQVIESIIAKGWQNDGSQNELLTHLVEALLLLAAPLVVKKKTDFVTATDDPTVQLVAYINKHYQTVTLDELAAHFGYSPHYLGNKLKAKLGTTFKHLVDLRRLNVACNLLQRTNLSIAEISARVGFDNHSSLFRLFKKELGMTPSTYRQRVTRPKHLDKLAEERGTTGQ